MWEALLSGVLSGIAGIVGPIFNFLNARVSAESQITLVRSAATGAVSFEAESALGKGDVAKAQVWERQGNWGPITWFMASVLVPLVWHLWQVVGDSSRWLPSYYWDGWLPVPTIVPHVIGSWHVATLPAPFDSVEMNIFTSLFIGASVAGAAHFAARAIKR